jgi:pyruvate/2-oxoglutarate dehydrogenase complex dihydrolipoamide acyltransferase (E2) component
MLEVVEVPRIDVNDDVVDVVSIDVAPEELVTKDAILGVVESQKASVEVIAKSGGYVRSILVEPSMEVQCGAPMFIIATTLEEPLEELLNDIAVNSPANPVSAMAEGDDAPRVTIKARKLAKELAINIDLVPAADGRSVRQEDIRNFAKQRGTTPGNQLAPHSRRPLKPIEKAVDATLNWAKVHTVPAYAEIMIDAAPIIAGAQAVQERTGLMSKPEFHLIAHALVRYVEDNPALISCRIEAEHIEYRETNLGFTVDVAGDLFMPVLQSATQFNLDDFIDAINALHLQALRRKLSLEDMRGMTIGITSLAAFGASRHIPVLPPFVSIMLSHSAPWPFAEGRARPMSLGATYDHQVHSGETVSKMLKGVATLAARAAEK